MRHFHAVAPHFPAQAPGAQRGTFPIILHEADIVQRSVDADGAVAFQHQGLGIGRARFHNDLVLIIVLQAVGVFAVTAVAGAAAGLHVGGAPWLGPEGTQRGGGVEGAGAHFQVVRLQDDAALRRPKGVQAQDKLLETWRFGVLVRH